MGKKSNYIDKVNQLQVKVEGNNNCADCKSRDPRWASYNLGIFICLNCSGIHRSLGTHISKVRSLDLDSWTLDQYKSMKSIGNLKANSYWEGSLDSNFEPPESNLEYWIRQKYCEKAFIGIKEKLPFNNNGEEESASDEVEDMKNLTDTGYSLEKARLLTNNMKPSSSKKALSQTLSNQKHPIFTLKGAQFFSIGTE